MHKAYLLSPGDHLGLSLGSLPLTPSNYLSLSHEIITFLMAKGKLGYMNGRLSKPNENSYEYEAWIEYGAMLRA